MLDVAELRKKWSDAVAADDKCGDLDNCAAGFAREHVPILLDEIEAERAIADTHAHDCERLLGLLDEALDMAAEYATPDTNRRIAEMRKLADEP